MPNWANFANRSISAQLPASEVTRPIDSQKIAISVIDRGKKAKEKRTLVLTPDSVNQCKIEFGANG
jgi:hypothetical protein